MSVTTLLDGENAFVLSPIQAPTSGELNVAQPPVAFGIDKSSHDAQGNRTTSVHAYLRKKFEIVV